MKQLAFAFLSYLALTAAAQAAEPAKPSAAAPAATSASAPTSIAVLDMQKLLEASLAGKSLQTQLKDKRDALQSEASGLEKKLKDEEQKLIAARAGMKPEEFDKKKKAFEDEVLNSKKIIIKKGTELETARKEALGKLRDAIAKATADVADGKKTQLVVDRQFVVIAEQSLDITDLVLAKMDQQVKSIPLNVVSSK